jgi:hypothetical protein
MGFPGHEIISLLSKPGHVQSPHDNMFFFCLHTNILLINDHLILQTLK